MNQIPATPGPRDPLHGVQQDMDELDSAALPEQVAIYERLHATLEAALSGTVDQPGLFPSVR